MSTVKMNIFIERENRKLVKEFSGKAEELLKQLDINPEVVLVVRNGELVADDAHLEEKDDVKILSVISGG